MKLSPGQQHILDLIDKRGHIKVSHGIRNERRHVFTGHGDGHCDSRSFDALLRKGLIEPYADSRDHPDFDWRCRKYVKAGDP